ncbi:cytochrome c [Altererythrobacter sp. ZODW24]|uniref:c-type cytochrome n=1 Tax=Altererythrobacter sp. ZODW24 TaxID=2185142 RepID=UPI0013B40AEF|nr:cytochrome c [Altererythrobacter sp. ZODW24]
MFVISLPILIAGCNTVTPAESEPQAVTAPQVKKQSDLPADPVRGLTFAQTYCSACHAVTADQMSPDPRAPSFAEIANARGLTGDSLTVWLTDSHNYPDVMTFEIQTENIDDLSAYMLELQDPDYEPPIG